MVVANVLLELANDATYVATHGRCDTKVLRSCLASTMDEVRLVWADRYAQMVLAERDLDDAGHFRHAVLRRELRGDISYPGQRDHSAHTLYNYLLGWLLYTKSQTVRTSFEKHLATRAGKAISAEAAPRAFANVWVWASLLHDVGYMFEGAIDVLETRLQDDRIRTGMSIARDYFEHRVWMEIGIGSKERRKGLLSMIGLGTPELSADSLAAVADSLRSLPSLTKLALAAQNALTERGRVVPPCLSNTNLPTDAFDLWALHYEAYEAPAMAARVRIADEMFTALLWHGLPGANARILDHGVCSGLLMLQYTTFYFALLAGVSGCRGASPIAADTWKLLEKRAGFTYDFGSWWSLHLWGTAAAAIHNVVQMAPLQGTKKMDPLKLDEDPIAFLGVLVDLLEDWDRYRVRREGLLLSPSQTYMLPLQSSEVTINILADGVELQIPNNRVEKLEKELDRALVDWAQIVQLSGV